MKGLEKGDFVMLALVAVVILGMAGVMAQNDREAGSSEYSGDVMADTSSNRSYETNRVDRTLTPQERDAWAEDSESYGFSDEDRAFAEEHGLDEAELRAAETILRENGMIDCLLAFATRSMPW